MHRAFGPSGDDGRLASARASVAADHLLAAFDGPAMVASARYYDMRQWWHGRSLPMAGVAAVKVAPEERGRGVGRALMTGLLTQLADRGYALSVLYPATSALYRSVGWEIGGGQYQVTIPARSLRSLQAPDPLTLASSGAGAGAPGAGAAGAGPPPAVAIRRAGPADAAEMIAIESQLHAAARDCGPITFDAATLTELLDDPGIYCYLAPDGLLTYQWNKSQGEVLVHVLAAGSGRTSRALWSIVASHGTMAERVRAMVSPDDPITWLVPEPDVALARREMWMLRLIDAPAAIAGRGFPAGADLAVPLALADPQLPANAGQWLLQVTGGKGALTPAGPGGSQSPAGLPGDAAPLRLGPRGLAAMYAGTPLATLRSAGLATAGDPAADAALDDAFAGAAYMFDYF
jgi:predicted N-acetyltransferase YhbS